MYHYVLINCVKLLFYLLLELRGTVDHMLPSIPLDYTISFV